MILQDEFYSIIFITIILAIVFIVVGQSVKKLDIHSKPKGLAHVTITAVSMLRNTVLANMGKRGEAYAAYVITVFFYILFSNISGLFGLNPPTGNYSVTLSLALISFIMVERTKIQTNGLKNYIKAFFQPIFLFFIPNFFGTFAKLVSMSLRLFGNITSGAIIMSLLYQFTGWLSGILGLGPINGVGWLLAPPLHFYFDLFSGFLQAFLFISLTTIFISIEFPES